MQAAIQPRDVDLDQGPLRATYRVEESARGLLGLQDRSASGCRAAQEPDPLRLALPLDADGERSPEPNGRAF
jgi:hypothetical protein